MLSFPTCFYTLKVSKHDFPGGDAPYSRDVALGRGWQTQAGSRGEGGRELLQ